MTARPNRSWFACRSKSVNLLPWSSGGVYSGTPTPQRKMRFPSFTWNESQSTRATMPFLDTITFFWLTSPTMWPWA